MTEQPERIVVFHLNQVGDLMFSLPALSALRAGFPNAKLTSVLPRGLACLLEGSPLVDGVIGHRGNRSFLDDVRKLRGMAPDVAVALSQSLRVCLLTKACAAERRWGFVGAKLPGVFTDLVPKSGPPSTVNNLRLVRAMGCRAPHSTYVTLLPVHEQDRAAARSLVGEWTERLVVVAPGASARRAHKEWPGECFARAVHELAAGTAATFLVVGTVRVPELAAIGHPRVRDLTGRTPLRVLVGLLDLADLFIGIDSGVMHLAAAVGTPCVALFGPTDPSATGPQGEGHVIIQAPEVEPGRRPMSALSVDAVVAGAKDALARTGNRAFQAPNSDSSTP